LDRTYLRALLEGLLVTFLWSTSYVLTKIGLRALPPLTFAAYRYIIASGVLLAIALTRSRGRSITVKADLPKLFLLGVAGYSVAQGLQCVGLLHLPAVTVTFLLNFTPVMVLLFGMVFLQEFPSPFQVAGMALALIGAYLFFLVPLSGAELTGVTATLLSGLGWAAYMVLSRQILRKEEFKPLNMTALSMFFGAITLFVWALLAERPVEIFLQEWAILLWLSLVNTALAFVLWNHALEQMKAFQLSVLQNTMLIQIGILAWIFLAEELTAAKVIAMLMVFAGVLTVQTAKPKPS